MADNERKGGTSVKSRRTEAPGMVLVQVHVRVLGMPRDLTLVRVPEHETAGHVVQSAFAQIKDGGVRPEYPTAECYTVRVADGLGNCTPESPPLAKSERLKDQCAFPYMLSLTLDPAHLLRRQQQLQQQESEERSRQAAMLNEEREQRVEHVLEARVRRETESLRRCEEREKQARLLRKPETAGEARRRCAEQHERCLLRKARRRQEEQHTRDAADAEYARWTAAETRRQVAEVLDAVLAEERARKTLAAQEQQECAAAVCARDAALAEHASGLWRRQHLTLLTSDLHQKMRHATLAYEQRRADQTHRREANAEKRRLYQQEKEQNRLRKQVHMTSSFTDKAVLALGNANAFAWN